MKVENYPGAAAIFNFQLFTIKHSNSHAIILSLDLETAIVAGVGLVSAIVVIVVVIVVVVVVVVVVAGRVARVLSGGFHDLDVGG